MKLLKLLEDNHEFRVAIDGWEDEETEEEVLNRIHELSEKYGLKYRHVDNFGTDANWIVVSNEPLNADEALEMLGIQENLQDYEIDGTGVFVFPGFEKQHVLDLNLDRS